MMDAALDVDFMRRALGLAVRGRGYVEPNPPVGCVIVGQGGRVVGEGWHRAFGGPHAEIEALRMAGAAAAQATLYVTLEPCCHHGKTPPCTEAILRAGIRRVVAAVVDPFPQVAGEGLRQLQAAGLEVAAGVLEAEARDLLAPYWKLTTLGQPWIIAKWAMTLDGRIASATGDSRWVSSEAARRVVHRLRGEVDAILVGRGTIAADDPLLTARPAGPRLAARIVLDSLASLPDSAQLVRTAAAAPVIVVTSTAAAPQDQRRLAAAGCEVLPVAGAAWSERLPRLLAELGRRRMTRVLVEGGAAVLGGFWDARALDEVHVFLAPKLLGGRSAPAPLGGAGVPRMADAGRLEGMQVELLQGDLYVHGRVTPRAAEQTNRFPRQPADQ